MDESRIERVRIDFRFHFESFMVGAICGGFTVILGIVIGRFI